MSEIFISYANEDTDFARRLAHAFEDEGWSVWWDKRIPPGMDYAKVIEAAVEQARCVVVLWSKYSIRSRWVQTEAAVGADREIVATVIVDEISADQVPFEFRRLQAVNLKDWRAGVEHAGYGALNNRVRSILQEPPRPVPAEDTDDGLISWQQALTSWGSGRQRVFRFSGAVAAIAGLVACFEAMDSGAPLFIGAGTGLILLAVFLMHLGRKPT